MFKLVLFLPYSAELTVQIRILVKLNYNVLFKTILEFTGLVIKFKETVNDGTIYLGVYHPYLQSEAHLKNL